MSQNSKKFIQCYSSFLDTIFFIQTVIMQILLCSALLLTIAVVLSTAQDYCHLSTCQPSGAWHTMCLFPNTPGPACGSQIEAIGPTQAERDMFLATHNNLRAFVAQGYEKRGINGAQPKATNMETMTWDSELETIAQRWVIQCTFGKDVCRDVARFTVGQNVGILSTIGNDTFRPNDILQVWYDEVEEFNQSHIALYQDDCTVARYTQLVWAKSTRLGCSSIRYKQNGGANSYYVVCNYGPAGNIVGQPIYQTS